MGKPEYPGRREERIGLNSSYYEIRDVSKIRAIKSSLLARLAEAGFESMVYDPWATAFYKKSSQQPAFRHESLLLCDYKVDQGGISYEGLRIVFRTRSSNYRDVYAIIIGVIKAFCIPLHDFLNSVEEFPDSFVYTIVAPVQKADTEAVIRAKRAQLERAMAIAKDGTSETKA